MEKILEMLKALGAKDEQLEEVRLELETYVDQQVVGLKKKNVELIKKLKQSDNPEVELKLEELENQMKDLLKEREKLAREKEKIERELTEKLTREEEELNAYVLENSLMQSLAKIGVRKEVLPVVATALKAKAKIKVDNGARVPVIGDKPLTEYIEKEWAQSDEGKFFIPAAGAGGSGSVSTSTTPGAKVMKRQDWQALDPAGQAAFIKEGGKVVD
jgi:NDP-sugar pyrophosphorylase family protein